MKRYMLPLIVAASASLWIIFNILVVPSLIHDAYHGESIGILNSIISGQADHPVEYYLQKWHHFVWVTTLVWVVVVVTLSFVSPSQIIKAWKRYWFRPTLLGYLAICRIVCVAMQLFLLITQDVYNRNRLLELSEMPDFLYDPLPVLHLFLWPWGGAVRPSLEVLITVYWITLGVGVVALLGFRSNSSLLLFAVGNTFLQAFAYSFGDMHHPEALMIITLWALALSPAGRALSLDDLLSRGVGLSRVKAQFMKKSMFATWPLLLVQYLFVITYLDAAIRKMWRAGLDWTNGYTLQFYLIQDGLLMRAVARTS